jgi:hypothetical protein
MADEIVPGKNTKFEPAEEFLNIYANNIQILSSNWDIEMVCGQFDQKYGANRVVQECSIKIPWQQAKLLWYFLSLHIAGHEDQFGRIPVAKGLVPQLPTEKPQGAEEKGWIRVKDIYAKFLDENPELK